MACIFGLDYRESKAAGAKPTTAVVFAEAGSWKFLSVGEKIIPDRLPISSHRTKDRSLERSFVRYHYVTGWVQWAQRFALIGTLLKHSAHSLCVGASGFFLAARAIRRFIGLMTKKNIDPATSKNEIRLLRKCPYINLLPFITNERFEKSGVLAIAPISGVRRSVTSAVTMVPNAAPITTPTAKSTTFPRSKNCLNSFNMRKVYPKMGLLPKITDPLPSILCVGILFACLYVVISY